MYKKQTNKECMLEIQYPMSIPSPCRAIYLTPAQKLPACTPNISHITSQSPLHTLLFLITLLFQLFLSLIFAHWLKISFFHSGKIIISFAAPTLFFLITLSYHTAIRHGNLTCSQGNASHAWGINSPPGILILLCSAAPWPLAGSGKAEK